MQRLLAKIAISLLLAVTVASAAIAGGGRPGLDPPKTSSLIANIDDFREPRRLPVSAIDPELAAMIGQMIVVGFSGDSVKNSEVKRLRQMIVNGRIGGVMLFRRNLLNHRQVKELTRFLTPSDAAIMPLIAIDQEGGKVQRLSSKLGYVRIPSARRVAGFLDESAAGNTYAVMARELERSGFNVNFGPVVDVDVNPASPVIGAAGRSFSNNPDRVIAYATEFLRAHQQMAVLTAAKHFPGHGSARVDSHSKFTDIGGTWSEQELLPFRGMIAAGVDMIMVGHLYHPRFSDGADVPASLSKRAVTDSLRHDLGFKGVVITDDLQMRSIERNRTLDEVVVMAVNAGNDVLLYGNDLHNDPGIASKVFQIIAAAVADGRISRARVAEAYGRIVTMKQRLAARMPDAAEDFRPLRHAVPTAFPGHRRPV